jgi:hypothetical protein
MLRYFFPIKVNLNCFFQRKNNNNIVSKKENPNTYKKLLDKNRNSYLNIAKENMVWFNNKMEKDYRKKRLKNSLFLCGNEISIIEPSIDEKEVIADVQETINTVTVIQDDKKYNKIYQYTCLFDVLSR